MLRESVNSTSRDFFDRYLEHEFRITRTLVTRPIQREVFDVIEMYHKWEKTRVKKPSLAGMGPTGPFTPTHFPPKDVKLAVDTAIGGNLLDKKALTRFFSKHLKSGDMPDMRVVNQHEIVLTFQKGVMSTGKKDPGTGKGQYQKAVDAALQDAYRDARADALDLLRYPHSRTSGVSMPIKDHQPGTKAPKRSSAAGKRDGYIKGHGRAKHQSGTVIASGDEQTTVAVMGLADGWDTIKRGEAVKPGKYQKDVMNMIGQVKKEIMDAIALEYKVYKFTKDGKGGGGIDDTIKVDMHATDQKGNAALQHYDAKGIRKFISQRATAIRDDLTSKMAHLEPDLSNSPKKRDRVIAQMQKQLIINLLGIDKGNPNMRLRVNKKLLKDIKISPKQMKKGKSDDLSRTIVKAIAGKALGGGGKKAKGSQRAARQSKNTSKTMESPIALRNLLNEGLPMMVASKMTSPALQFRTGRFANSARVENVNIGPRGGIGIDYTYMRNPYETFEPGGKQGSTQRDPRKIIGASIRELAMGIMGRQPTTIRRN